MGEEETLSLLRSQKELCLPESACLGCYVPTVITEVSRLYFIFQSCYCLYFCVVGLQFEKKKKGGGGNNTVLGVPDHPSSI